MNCGVFVFCVVIFYCFTFCLVKHMCDKDLITWHKSFMAVIKCVWRSSVYSSKENVSSKCAHSKDVGRAVRLRANKSEGKQCQTFRRKPIEMGSFLFVPVNELEKRNMHKYCLHLALNECDPSSFYSQIFLRSESTCMPLFICSCW